MAGHWEVLSAVSSPTLSDDFGGYHFLSENERNLVVVEWNNTAKDEASSKYIHELFEEQVERAPEAIAVIFEEHHLSYRELNRRSNQLALYLEKSSGLAPRHALGFAWSAAPIWWLRSWECGSRWSGIFRSIPGIPRRGSFI